MICDHPWRSNAPRMGGRCHGNPQCKACLYPKPEKT